MRPGFIELLDFLECQGVSLIVISGGLRGIVEVFLDRIVHRVEKIYAVDVDISSTYLKVISQYEGDTELLAKVQVMDRYLADEKIAIGDSITDLNMGLQASVIFARPPLTQYLDEYQKSYIPWNDFLQIRDYLAKSWS